MERESLPLEGRGGGRGKGGGGRSHSRGGGGGGKSYHYIQRGIRPYKRYHYRGPKGEKYRGPNGYYNRYRPVFRGAWVSYPWFRYYRGFPPDSPFWYLLSLYPYGDPFWATFDYYPPTDPYWLRYSSIPSYTYIGALNLGKDSSSESSSGEEGEEEEVVEERKESERNAYFLSGDRSSGLQLERGQIWHYYEEIEFFRERVKMPSSLSQTIWSILSTVRDGTQEEDWQPVDDADRGGEIFVRLENSFLLLVENGGESSENYSGTDMRHLLQLVVSNVQRKEKRVLFELTSYDRGGEWGLLVRENGEVMKYGLQSRGNRMEDKWTASKPSGIVIGEERLESLMREAFELERVAEGFVGERPETGEGGTIFMSYISESPFIVHTEGRILLIHKSHGGACHRLYDSFLSLTSQI